MIHAIYIINRSGGLIYSRDFSGQVAQLSSNEALIFAGTFHGIHALAARVSPALKPGATRDLGIQSIDTKSFRVHCYQTPTGIKFIAVTDLLRTSLADVLARTYRLYCDYVLKNPFYSLEMPIRSDMFDATLAQAVKAG
ncbi:hypothetical protein H4R18_002901 [Coemansia javaensis]|uniref:Trafficking protein particle complex subunit n=1 Tax=Coemansia javaensis TaxID=2761396 RepID=A0A9W8LJ90_9FUNG|nr:hypothetical protein H4R18_002901 [Coemansia javaensis]